MQADETDMLDSLAWHSVPRPMEELSIAPHTWAYILSTGAISPQEPWLHES